MSKYGFSSSGGIPAVTDEDFSYITSQDLDDPGMLGASDGRGSHPRAHSVTRHGPEDDILIIKNKGVTYPAHFPAYTIGDGKLRVKDVRDRVGLIMELSERATRRVKLLYKGRQLKEPASPVRDYGVKNNSELMAVLPELDNDSSPSEEEMVVVGEGRSKSKGKKKKKSKAGKRPDGETESTSSPRDSNAFDASLPSATKPKQPGVPGPIKKLKELSDEFENKWVPLCDAYIASPPEEEKKRTDEHRKLSESILQQILIKLDGIESDGIAEVRPRRKELVQRVQEVLKKLDVAKAGQ